MDNVKVFVLDLIQTIVDILRDPFLGGEMRSVADIVQESFASKYRNNEELISEWEHMFAYQVQKLRPFEYFWDRVSEVFSGLAA